MNRFPSILGWIAVSALCIGGSAAVGQIAPVKSLPKAVTPNVAPPETVGVDVVERLGHQVPLDIPFVDADGKPVELGKYFHDGKPVILALVYFDCPVVCPIVMGKLTDALKQIDFSIGKDYSVVIASIDPKETPELAKKNKVQYVAAYGHDEAQTNAGWAFLTAPGDETRMLAHELGWNYRPVSNGQYSHPVCIFILSPDGKVARYLYGLEYDPQTMRMALLEASQGKISPSIGDRVRMFCFQFDPNTGKYSIVAMRVAQLTGVVMMLAMGSLIGGLLIKERIRKRRTGGLGETHMDFSPLNEDELSDISQESGPTR